MPRPAHLVALGLALAIALAIHGVFPGWFGALDNRFGDMLWKLGSSNISEQRVVVVDIDEASLKEIGPWPWPREKLSALSTALAQQGAGLQIVDIVLNESLPGDAALADVLRRNDAVIAQVFAVDQGAAVSSGQLIQDSRSPPCSPPIPDAHGYIAPSTAYANAKAGHVTPRIAEDGIVRQQPAFVCMQGKAYPALALSAYLGGAGVVSPLQLQAGQGGAFALSPPFQIYAPGMTQGIPLDARGDLHIPYTLTPDAIVAVSAADVLAGRLPANLLKGSWALVSSTAFGLGDVVATPLAGAQSGANVHVQLLAGLLDGRIPYPPQGTAMLQMLAAMAALIVLLLAVRWRRPPGYTLPLAGIVLAAALLAFQAYFQLKLHLLVGMSQPAFIVLLGGLFLGLAEFIRTGGEHSRLMAYLASYLPGPVAARLLAQAPRDIIEAEQREVTVLFADIRNFSAYCEAYDAEHAATLLHQFLVTTSQVVEATGGLIEAMQGDAIMAVWNGSAPCPQHAARALKAAREMHPLVEAGFPQIPAAAGQQVPPLALGIGIESGVALIGSFGPKSRRMHTALGHTVTRATRLQALTADLSWPILAGPGLKERLPDADLLPQGEFLLEGLTRPCTVYAVAPSA